MNHHQSLGRIVLTCTLLVAATATTTHCQAWDPFGIQDQHEYMPFGPYGPKLTIGTPSPTKIRSGGKFGQKNRTPSRNSNAAQNNTAAQRSRVAQRTSPSRTIRFDDLNLSVTTPSGPWEKLDPQQTGSKARLLLRRSNPTIIISLAGERVDTEAADRNTAATELIGVEPREQGFGATDTNSSLLAESQAKLRSLPGAEIKPGDHEVSAGGIPGVAYEATVASGESTVYYSLWVAAHHGYNYKLAVYGDYLHKRMIDDAMQNFLSGLKPIQPKRVARRNGNQKTTMR
jgi:hypothetical protein